MDRAFLSLYGIFASLNRERETVRENRENTLTPFTLIGVKVLFYFLFPP